MREVRSKTALHFFIQEEVRRTTIPKNLLIYMQLCTSTMLNQVYEKKLGKEHAKPPCCTTSCLLERRCHPTEFVKKSVLSYTVPSLRRTMIRIASGEKAVTEVQGT